MCLQIVIAIWQVIWVQWVHVLSLMMKEMRLMLSTICLLRIMLPPSNRTMLLLRQMTKTLVWSTDKDAEQHEVLLLECAVHITMAWAQWLVCHVKVTRQLWMPRQPIMRGQYICCFQFTTPSSLAACIFAVHWVYNLHMRKLMEPSVHTCMHMCITRGSGRKLPTMCHIDPQNIVSNESPSRWFSWRWAQYHYWQLLGPEKK